MRNQRQDTTYLNFYLLSREHLEPRLLQDHKINRTAGIESLQISPDGRHLLVGLHCKLSQGWFELWDMGSKSCLQKFHDAEHMAFIPDNRLVEFSPGKNHQVLHIKDLKGAVLKRIHLKFVPKRINSFATSSNSLIAVRGNSHGLIIEQRLQIWTLDGKLLQSFPAGTKFSGPFNSQSIKFSPDGRLLAVGGEGVVLIDSAHQSSSMSGPTAVTTAIDLFSDLNTTMLVSGNRWGSITLQKYSKHQDRRSRIYLREHSNPIQDLGFSNNGAYMTSLSTNGHAILWDVMSGNSMITPSGPVTDKKYQTTHVKLSNDCGYLITGEKSGTLWLWSVESRELLRALQRPPGDGYPEMEQLQAVEFSSDACRLFSSHRDGVIVVWETASGVSLAQIQGDPRGDPFLCLAVSRDDTKLAAGSKQHGYVLLWDIQSPECKSLGKWTNVEITKILDGQAMSFSPEGRFICSGTGMLLLEEDLPESPRLPCKLLWDSDTWITRQDGSHILWLPPKYRPTIGSRGFLFKSSHNTIAFGCEDGLVVWIEIGCNCSDLVEGRGRHGRPWAAGLSGLGLFMGTHSRYSAHRLLLNAH
ncbi:WD40-repeat-containing domain protein [Tricladium varicosporioides]|nr:WD40-repeat-containing domain protein [Hymenoscyphus varicosporioides]